MFFTNKPFVFFFTITAALFPIPSSLLKVMYYNLISDTVESESTGLSGIRSVLY